MDVSENSGTPKSSILIGFSIINHPFWGIPIFGNTHIIPIFYGGGQRKSCSLPQGFLTNTKRPRTQSGGDCWINLGPLPGVKKTPLGGSSHDL